MGAITYIGNDSLYIQKIFVSTEDTGMTKFGIWADSTVSGGETKDAVNLNLSSAIESETTIINNADGTAVTVTGGSSVGTIRLYEPSTYIIEYDDALIMTRNSVFAIKTSASTTGSKTRATIIFFEE